jgi:prophage maintenance system killer protein
VPAYTVTEDSNINDHHTRPLNKDVVKRMKYKYSKEDSTTIFDDSAKYT